MDTLRFIWGLTILICMSCQVANAQIQGCSLLGVDFEKCMEPDESSASMEPCCKTLNHAVQAGYYCLCLLFRSSPLLSISLSVQLSSCYISVPSLTQCQKSLPIFPTPTTPDPALHFPLARPVPVQLPPERPEDLMQPSVPDDILVPLPPKRDEIRRNPISAGNNSSVAEGPPILSSDVHPILFIPEPRYLKSHGGDKFNILPQPRLLLPVALFVIL